MYNEVLGISGSPIPNSNTDRLIQHILENTGKTGEFIKLSKLNIRPCLACKKCASNNICIQKDDFYEVAEKMKHARAIIIGGYTPYGMLDGFTKAFLERWWSMRHVNSLNEGKITVTVLSSLREDVGKQVLKSMAHIMRTERTKHISELLIKGNLPCLVCGYGDTCKNGYGIQILYGNSAKASSDYCVAVEEQEVWEEAENIGKQIGVYLEK